MKNKIEPYINELPSKFSERVATDYAAHISKDQKKELGQFFTSANLAKFMSSMADFNLEKSQFKILDPGCGVLTLTCALVETMLEKNVQTHQVEIDAYDIDPLLIDSIDLVSNYLVLWCEKRNVKVNINLSNSDFILTNEEFIKSDSSSGKYDFIISNPPYFKIKKQDPRLAVFKNTLQGQQNIYSLFLLASYRLLNKKGELIFIVPRSFTSGLYFQSFREMFLGNVLIEDFHIFNSRKEGFKRDQVLQENIILKAKLKKAKTSYEKIRITSSKGISDLENIDRKEFSINQLIKTIGKLNVIHLPVNIQEENAIELFSTWTNNLKSLGMKVSTGPIVPFRSKTYLKHRKSSSQNCVPLLWMHNCLKMELNWPNKKAEKESWVIDNSSSNSKTIQNGNYIFLRRFSSKDDSSKLIATPHIKEELEFDKLGIENHLNYLYKPNGIMDNLEVFGLSVLFNSSLFDSYFRSLTGNTQVSATELNSISLPSIDTIQKIGKQYLSLNGRGILEIDNIVNSAFGLTEKQA